MLKKWNVRTMVTVKTFVEALIEWHHEKYLDPGIWDRLRAKLRPTLLPEPSDLEPCHPELPPPLEYLVRDISYQNLSFSNVHFVCNLAFINFEISIKALLNLSSQLCALFNTPYPENGSLSALMACNAMN